MRVGEVVWGQVVRRIAPRTAGCDPRAVRALGWLVTGLMLEHDARSDRIALEMSGERTHTARVPSSGACPVKAAY